MCLNNFYISIIELFFNWFTCPSKNGKDQQLVSRVVVGNGVKRRNSVVDLQLNKFAGNLKII